MFEGFGIGTVKKSKPRKKHRFSIGDTVKERRLGTVGRIRKIVHHSQGNHYKVDFRVRNRFENGTTSYSNIVPEKWLLKNRKQYTYDQWQKYQAPKYSK